MALIRKRPVLAEGHFIRTELLAVHIIRMFLRTLK